MLLKHSSCGQTCQSRLQARTLHAPDIPLPPAVLAATLLTSCCCCWCVLQCCLQLFELPSQYAVRVPIRHPTNDAISALGLQWYAIPAVANMELSVGGITYTAAPFNGW